MKTTATQVVIGQPTTCQVHDATNLSLSFLCMFSADHYLIQGLCDPVGCAASYSIKIYSEALYDKSDLQPVITKDVLVELMNCATFSVKFSFNNTMYKQTDRVANGRPLGPTLANIFVGYYQQKLFSQTQKPPTYFRYVDDTFAIFNHKAKAHEFVTKLN